MIYNVNFQEIAALTQRCSDLQFQLTMQERAAKVEEELRARLTEVELVVEEERRGRNEANDALVELVAKREELEAALAWERLEWKNRAEGLEARLGEKEETIGKLKGELVVQVQILHRKGLATATVRFLLRQVWLSCKLK